MVSRKKWLTGLFTLLIVGAAIDGSLLAQGNTCPGCSEPATVLHPNGFGPHTYARWKARIGLTDAPISPNTNMCLFMNHQTTDVVGARAVAAIEGFDNQSTTGISKLEFWVRQGSTDGCTPTSPRWRIRYDNGTTNNNIFEVGCANPLMTPGGSATGGDGVMWQQKSLLLPPLPLPSCTTTCKIISLSIQYDDVFVPSTHIDNIGITFNGQTFTWVGPASNGNGNN